MMRSPKKSILCEFWGCFSVGPVIQKVRCLHKALSVKLNELIGKSTKHSSFETAIPFGSNILFGELLCKFTMATCSLSSLFRLTSLCGARSRDPHDLQCGTLRDCNKDVHPHLKSLEIGPDEVNSFGKEVERTCTLVKSFPHKEERLLGKL